MRIIVCGSRDWRDYEAVRSVLDALLASRGPFALVHGACPTGADSIARAWGLGVVPLDPHPADWKALGNAAGPARNERMAELGAELLLAFWDGRSRGTRDMIRRAVAHGIPVRIVAPIDPVLALRPRGVLMAIENRTSYLIPPALLATWLHDLATYGAGARGEIVVEDFRDEPHLYLHVYRGDEWIDYLLGPYCAELGEY